MGDIIDNPGANIGAFFDDIISAIVSLIHPIYGGTASSFEEAGIDASGCYYQCNW